MTTLLANTWSGNAVLSNSFPRILGASLGRKENCPLSAPSSHGGGAAMLCFSFTRLGCRLTPFAFGAMAVVLALAKADGQQAKARSIRVGTSGPLTAETDSRAEKSALEVLSGLIKKETGLDNE